MVRFFLNSQVFNNPADWAGFSTSFKRDYEKRIISVQYTDTITFSGAAHDYILSVKQADGYCAEIDLRTEEQCGNGAWNVMARGKVIMADCEWNETKCTVQCSVVDNGIGARVANNKKVPVSPLADKSKNDVTITPVTPIDLTMFNTAGANISGTRRVFDWFLSLQHALAYITDGSVTITSDWYANLPDDEKYAVAVVPELRTAGFNVPRIAWTFDDLFTEMSKKHNLWLFATEDSAGNAKLILEPEPYFLGTGISNTVLNIEDLIRKTDIERLYATVDVGSEDGIVELGSANPLPFVVLNGFSKETFHFSGVCNTDASLDLVNKWIIDTNVIYQIIQENNEDFDKNIALVQYTASTSKATRSRYLFPGSNPYLYNERLLNYNVVGRFPLPSSVGVNLAPGFDDSFRAEYTDESVAAITPWHMDYYYSGAYPTYQLGFDNDYDAPNFDVNNVWGSDYTPGVPVPILESDFKASAQGAYVFRLGIVMDLFGVVPVVVDPTYMITSFQKVSLRIYAEVYDASATLVQTITVGDTPYKYLYGLYEADEMTFTVSLDTDYRVKILAKAMHVGNIAGDGNDPTEPQPDGNSDSEGDVRLTLGVGSWIQTDKIANGGFVIPPTSAQTESFTFERYTDANTWLMMTRNPGFQVVIDGNRKVYPLDMKRKITGETQYEMIKQP